MAPTKTPLSSILPPLLFGTATFNHQYNKDPYALDTTGLVRSALEKGIRAFDTSPYYGPSESLLGAALSTPFVTANFPRDEYFLLTKVGRVASDEFDYSPEWVRASVARSLRRLQTPYLDVVYCHDVEFVSDDEVVAAVRELRRIRDADGSVRYVGISGYPVDTLCRLAERVLGETGEPLDAVMSYANYTLQSTALATRGVRRLLAAGVDVVPNASPLGMGLLRREGVPVGSMGDFHPACSQLRAAVRDASDLCDMHGEQLEVIAIRFALETWLHAGAAVGARGDPASGVPWQRERIEDVGGQKLGVSVMGVSQPTELDKTMMVWRSILDGLEDGQRVFADRAGRWKRAHEWSLNRKRAVQILAEGVQECLGAWVDYAWDSPAKGFVNQRRGQKQAQHEGDGKQKTLKGKEAEAEAPWLTPAASPEPEAQAQEAEGRELPLR